jgi:hypothetical protein
MKHDEAMNAVMTDWEKENGLCPEGRLVHVSTVSHAFRGRLKLVTPSHYILERNAVLVALTGQTGGKEGYAATQVGQEEDQPIEKAEVWIPRAAVSWMLVFDE